MVKFQTQHTETSAQTDHSIQAAAGAGLKNYICTIAVGNGAVAGTVSILDGSGGTVLWHGYLDTNSNGSLHFNPPLAGTANTSICLTSTSCTTHAVTVTGWAGA